MVQTFGLVATIEQHFEDSQSNLLHPFTQRHVFVAMYVNLEL